MISKIRAFMESENNYNHFEVEVDFNQVKQWVRNVREQSDKTAFEKLFYKYYRQLHGFAFSYVEDINDAEDIVQNVFLRIWLIRETWDPPGSVKSYLYKSVRNEALNIIRHKKIKNDSREELIELLTDLIRQDHSVEDHDVTSLHNAIQKSVNHLPAGCKEIYLLNRRNGLTYEEISNYLEISINSVNSQMKRALRLLRENLSDYTPI